jgi:hypothetical protein
MEWFRMYSEFASDPKVQSMPEVMQRRLVMLLCLRCSNTLVTLQDDEVAFALRISETELAESKVLFMRKGFVNDDWEIMNWDKRQFVSDSSAARVAKHRAAKKQASSTPEKAADSACNVTVTPQNRTDTEQTQNRTEAEQSKGKTLVERKTLDPASNPVQTIFAFWQKVMASPKSALDKKRRVLIEGALQSYQPADICKAIRGCSKSPHNMGKNDRNTKYNGLNLILRDAEHIDYFMNLDSSAAKPAAETVEQMNARITAEFLGDAQADDENTIEMEA